MFRTIASKYPKDNDLPDRAFRIQMLSRVRDGTLYDALPQPFHREYMDNGEYVPLRDRRPAVRYRLCRLVVDDSVSILFDDGHFPEIECDDDAAAQDLRDLIREIGLSSTMIAAATKGSVGSVALYLRILKRRPFVDVLDTTFLTPVWQKEAPDTLERIEERYKAKGEALKAAGYAIPDDRLKVDYWFARDLTDAEELWYQPMPVADLKDGVKFLRDDDRTVRHGLGFVPAVWLRNLPGGDAIDGEPTFPDEAIDTGIEIDYQLSQAGRGLKYSQDPKLVMKEPAGVGSQMRADAANAIVVSEDGDAKLLEIDGSAAKAVMEYVNLLRELAIESMHGNRASADKQANAASGRALELMNQNLIWLAGRLRVAYGEAGLLGILRMIVAAAKLYPLVNRAGKQYAAIATDKPITLRWPDWYSPTPADRQAQATTLGQLTDSALMSRETAIRIVSGDYAIADPAAEKALADADMAERNADAQKQISIKE